MNQPSASDKDKLEAMIVPQIDGNMNPIQEEYSLKIIKLAKENGINLMYVETPKYYNMANDQSYISAMKQYINFLEKEDVKYILNVSTWDLTGRDENVRKYTYDNSKSEYFVDYGHLSYAGRLEFTKQIEKLHR